MTTSPDELVAKLNAFEAKHPEEGRRLWRTVDAAAASCLSESRGEGTLEIPCFECDEVLVGKDAWIDHIETEHRR